MSEVFIICNQDGHYWGKSKQWVDGSDRRAVMRVKHRDEATNTLFELSSKDFELRGDVVEAPANDKGEPMVAVSDIPLPTIPDADEESADAIEENGAAEPSETVAETPPQD
ncbi:MAG: hypothetical protein V7746_07845 [Halioglobus sp.]